MSLTPVGIRDNANSPLTRDRSIEQASQQRQDQYIRSVKDDRDQEDGTRGSYQVTLSVASRQFSSQETDRVYAKPEARAAGDRAETDRHLKQYQQDQRTESANQQSQLSVVRALESYSQVAALDGKHS